MLDNSAFETADSDTAAVDVSARRFSVEVKIGVAESSRELVVSSAQSPDEIEALVNDALVNPTGLLTLVDDKGRRYVLPAARVSYVEIAPADSRRVGFGIG